MVEFDPGFHLVPSIGLASISVNLCLPGDSRFDLVPRHVTFD